MSLTEFEDPFEANAAMPKATLSPSSIATFMRCPEQYRREHIKGEDRGRGAWGVSGTAFHEARHRALSLAQAGTPIPEDDVAVELLYDEAWRKTLEEEGEIEWRGTSADDQYAIGLGMFREYHFGLGKDVVPIKMEGWARGYLPGVPVPVVGRIDVETAEEVIDTKTGKQLFHKLKPDYFVQGCIYVWLTGKPIQFHSVSQKPAAATNDLLRLSPRPKVLTAARAYVVDAYEGIASSLRTRGEDREWPGTGPASGNCTYCRMRSNCLYVPTF